MPSDSNSSSANRHPEQIARLPEPDVLAEEIVEHLRAAVASFEAVTG